MPLGKKTSNIPSEYVKVSTSKASRNHRKHISGYEGKTTEPYRRKSHFRKRRRTLAEIAQLGRRKDNPHWWDAQARKRRKEEKKKRELLKRYGGP
jgi:hypothetical protein